MMAQLPSESVKLMHFKKQVGLGWQLRTLGHHWLISTTCSRVHYLHVFGFTYLNPLQGSLAAPSQVGLQCAESRENSLLIAVRVMMMKKVNGAHSQCILCLQGLLFRKLEQNVYSGFGW